MHIVLDPLPMLRHLLAKSGHVDREICRKQQLAWADQAIEQVTRPVHSNRLLLGITHIVSEDFKMQSTSCCGLELVGKDDNFVPPSGRPWLLLELMEIRQHECRLWQCA